MKELEKMQSLWTRSFFVSTAGNVSNETIKRYVESQKKRSQKIKKKKVYVKNKKKDCSVKSNLF